MFSDILQTNTGVQLSKLTNTYSRIGGAYGNGEIYRKEMFKNIAIFPTLATLSSVNPFEEQTDDSDKIRLTSQYEQILIIIIIDYNNKNDRGKQANTY